MKIHLFSFPLFTFDTNGKRTIPLYLWDISWENKYCKSESPTFVDRTSLDRRLHCTRRGCCYSICCVGAYYTRELCEILRGLRGLRGLRYDMSFDCSRARQATPAPVSSPTIDDNNVEYRPHFHSYITFYCLCWVSVESLLDGTLLVHQTATYMTLPELPR